MITLKQVMIGVVSGGVLVMFGLVPGLLQGLGEAIYNFRDLLSSLFPSQPHRYDPIRQSRLLAGLGLALIVATLLAYISAKM